MLGPRIASLSLALAFLLVAPALAETAPLFGPEPFVLSDSGSESFSATFPVEQTGTYLVIVRNGDTAGGRVESAVVSVNESGLVLPGELTADQGGAARKVELEAGEAELVVDLDGAPGAFVTIAVGRPERPPLFVMGRLVLPWGRDDVDTALSLALKNGSIRFPRAVRVVFYGPAGAPLAKSQKIVLPPRASFGALVDDVIADGSWEAGSIEIYYAGPGTARLFGSARQVGLPPLGWSDIESLQHAGHLIYRGAEVAAPAGPLPLRRGL